MNRRNLLLAALAGLAAVMLGSVGLPAVGGVFGVWRLSTWGYKLLHITGSGRFVPVQGAKDVYQFDLWWRALPIVLIPNTAILVREGGSWVLIDAGSPDSWSHAYASQLVQAAQNTVGHGRLKAILLTHGHLDHTGALEQLLQIYSDVPVIAHIDEAPFLVGGEEYVAPTAQPCRALRALGAIPSRPPKLPESRVTFLRGNGGNLRPYGVQSLSWTATPGHTPGHISFLHSPSSSLLAGDAILNMLPSFSWAGGIEAFITRPLGWAARPMVSMAFVPVKAALERLRDSKLPAVNATLSALGFRNLPSRPSAGVIPTTAVGKELGTYKLVRLLPGITVRISPSIVCTGPHCEMEHAQESVCRLSKLKFRRLLPMHDASGRGLLPADIAAFADSLPACNPAAGKLHRE